MCTQKEMILAAFQRGDMIKGSDSFPRYSIAEPSLKRIIKELRDSGIPILDIETLPVNGGHPYKTYYLKGCKDVPKEPKEKAHQEQCRCMADGCTGSYWYIGRMCVKCGAETGKGHAH